MHRRIALEVAIFAFNAFSPTAAVLRQMLKDPEGRPVPSVVGQDVVVAPLELIQSRKTEFHHLSASFGGRQRLRPERRKREDFL